MSYPQDPYQNNPLSYDPLGRVPFPDPPPQPPLLPPQPPLLPPQPPVPPPPALPYRPRVNTLATLSVVFAFVFAPVGAILGHLGLAQIRRYGELGRSRAVLGMALSYAFIALTVAALIAWVEVRPPAPKPTAPGTAAAPPGPTVSPDALAPLLPGLGDLQTLTGDHNLEAGPTWDRLRKSDEQGSIDRPECWGSIAPGMPDAYNVAAVTGYRLAEFADTRSLLSSVQVIEAVAALRDPGAAQSQLDDLVSGWRQCGGSTVGVSVPRGETIPFVLGRPVDAGNGITTLDLTPRGLKVRCARAIAAKANVVVDVYLSYSGTTEGDGPRSSAVSIANFILGKVPG